MRPQKKRFRRRVKMCRFTVDKIYYIDYKNIDLLRSLNFNIDGNDDGVVDGAYFECSKEWKHQGHRDQDDRNAFQKCTQKKHQNVHDEQKLPGLQIVIDDELNKPRRSARFRYPVAE